MRFWTGSEGQGLLHEEQNQYNELFLNTAELRRVVVVMYSTLLPGNGSVLLSKVYKVDCKRHGAHCQHIHNFEG